MPRPRGLFAGEAPPLVDGEPVAHVDRRSAAERAPAARAARGRPSSRPARCAARASSRRRALEPAARLPTARHPALPRAERRPAPRGRCRARSAGTAAATPSMTSVETVRRGRPARARQSRRWSARSGLSMRHRTSRRDVGTGSRAATKIRPAMRVERGAAPHRRRPPSPHSTSSAASAARPRAPTARRALRARADSQGCLRPRARRGGGRSRAATRRRDVALAVRDRRR